MLTLEGVTSVLQRMVDQDDKPLAKPLRIDLDGLGKVQIQGKTVTPGDLPADCIMQLSPDDFEKIMSGELVTFNALVSGRLKVSGDLMVAREFRRMLTTAQDQHRL